MTIKDANDLLQAWLEAGLPIEDQRERVERLLGGTRTLVETVCWEVATLDGPERDTAQRKAAELILRMSEPEQAQYRLRLARALGISQGELKSIVKAVAADKEKKQGGAALELVDYLGGYLKGNLVELLYDAEAVQTSFAVRFEDGRIEKSDGLDVDGVRYIPAYPNSMILKNVVLLPSELMGLQPTPELVERIRRFIHRYLDVDEFYENLSSYYVLFTWLYDCFPQLPYLRALGDYGTGKSRLLFVVGAVCYRPIFTGGATTTSPIFRILDQWRGTLILDEADFGRSDEAADIIKILNTGYQKGVPVLRTAGDSRSGFDIQAFDVYGPKIIGTRKRFQDKATESRCLTKEMGGGMPRHDIPMVLPKVFWQEALEIRNLLLAYRMHHWQPEIDVDFNQTNRLLEPRLNQVTLALKKVVGDDVRMMDEIDRFVLDYNRQLTTERSMTMTAKVLEALVACGPTFVRCSSGETRGVYLKDLGLKVNELVNAQNRAMGDDVGEEQNQAVSGVGGDKKRSRITSRKVGDILRSYLQLRTDRSTAGEADRKGSYFVVWDEERVAGLCTRWGVTFEDGGKKVEVESILAPKQETLEAFAAAREAWKGAGETPHPTSPQMPAEAGHLGGGDGGPEEFEEGWEDRLEGWEVDDE